jgi:hypothetical protein
MEWGGRERGKEGEVEIFRDFEVNTGGLACRLHSSYQRQIFSSCMYVFGYIRR